MNKKVSFHTLGCRLNISESGSIMQGFVQKGYEIVPFGSPADVVFINTCTVTDNADSTCRNVIRKASHSSPEGRIVVAGCYAQMASEKISSIEGVDLVLGTNEKFKVFDYLESEEKLISAIDLTNEFWGASTSQYDTHTRAFLKIQDGCNYVCSYCIIPFARGRSRTIKLDDAVREAKKIAQAGFKEIILTGVNVGEFESTSGIKLEFLISEIAKVEGIQRIRLSSVEPNTITLDLLKNLKAIPQFLPHFHIPLQSGCDEILSKMKRKYRISDYARIIGQVKEYFPEASLGADVIVGFPGESAEQFDETLAFLESSNLTHLHVFPFSKRNKTVAARLPDQVSPQVKKERVNALIKMGEKKLSELLASMIGKKSQVLIEQEEQGAAGKEGEDPFYIGYTENYLKIKVKGPQIARNAILRVDIVGMDGNLLIGQAY